MKNLTIKKLSYATTVALLSASMIGCGGGSGGDGGADSSTNGGKGSPVVAVKSSHTFDGAISHRDEYNAFVATFKNTGDVDLTGVTFETNNLLIDSQTCTDTIAAGSECTVNAVFRPDADFTDYNLALTMLSNEADAVVESDFSQSEEGRVSISRVRGLPAIGVGDANAVYYTEYRVNNNTGRDITGFELKYANDTYDRSTRTRNMHHGDCPISGTLNAHQSCYFVVENVPLHAYKGTNEHYTLELVSDEGFHTSIKETMKVANTILFDTEFDDDRVSTASDAMPQYFDVGEKVHFKHRVQATDTAYGEIRDFNVTVTTANGEIVETTNQCNGKSGGQDCDIEVDYTPAHAGNSAITVTYSWNEHNMNGRDNDFTQTKTFSRPVIDTVTVPTVDMYSDEKDVVKVAFDANDIWQGKAHDNRYGLIFKNEDQVDENGVNRINGSVTQVKWMEDATSNSRAWTLKGTRSNSTVKFVQEVDGYTLQPESAYNVDANYDDKVYTMELVGYIQDPDKNGWTMEDEQTYASMLVQRNNGDIIKRVIIPVQLNYVN